MKKYTAPELEIMEFELEDVLTVSLEDGKEIPGNGVGGWF